MRPKSVIAFEVIMIATLIIGVFQSVLAWNELTSEASKLHKNPQSYVLIMQSITVIIMICLTLLVSRRKNRVALWVFVIFFALGLPAFLVILEAGKLFGSGLISAIQTIGQTIAFILIFTPSARTWMREKGLRIDRSMDIRGPDLF